MRSSHLRIKDAGRRLDDADNVLENGKGVDDLLGSQNESSQAQCQIGGVHIQLDRVRNELLLTSRDLGLVLGHGQVAHRFTSLDIEKLACNDVDIDGLGLVVGDVDGGIGEFSVDESHTKLRVGEDGASGDIELMLGSSLLFNWSCCC